MNYGSDSETLAEMEATSQKARPRRPMGFIAPSPSQQDPTVTSTIGQGAPPGYMNAEQRLGNSSWQASTAHGYETDGLDQPNETNNQPRPPTSSYPPLQEDLVSLAAPQYTSPNAMMNVYYTGQRNGPYYHGIQREAADEESATTQPRMNDVLPQVTPSLGSYHTSSAMPSGTNPPFQDEDGLSDANHEDISQLLPSSSTYTPAAPLSNAAGALLLPPQVIPSSTTNTNFPPPAPATTIIAPPPFTIDTGVDYANRIRDRLEHLRPVSFPDLPKIFYDHTEQAAEVERLKDAMLDMSQAIDKKTNARGTLFSTKATKGVEDYRKQKITLAELRSWCWRLLRATLALHEEGTRLSPEALASLAPAKLRDADKRLSIRERLDALYDTLRWWKCTWADIEDGGRRLETLVLCPQTTASRKTSNKRTNDSKGNHLRAQTQAQGRKRTQDQANQDEESDGESAPEDTLPDSPRNKRRKSDSNMTESLQTPSDHRSLKRKSAERDSEDAEGSHTQQDGSKRQKRVPQKQLTRSQSRTTRNTGNTAARSTYTAYNAGPANIHFPIDPQLMRDYDAATHHAGTMRPSATPHHALATPRAPAARIPHMSQSNDVSPNGTASSGATIDASPSPAPFPAMVTTPSGYQIPAGVYEQYRLARGSDQAATVGAPYPTGNGVMGAPAASTTVGAANLSSPDTSRPSSQVAPSRGHPTSADDGCNQHGPGCTGALCKKAS